ncbi:hypothetical protein HCN44_004419 [Aphidius gifuensis]|uniref:Protein aurora borealis n=1 Tax=Aphidius gifuensis TaxID=684658 RepID=A0A834XZ17_APHGI|nr:protein aurora borealis [Aphidius gifuensis]KAF7994947.1 hypothetical protein HCN44_004419 [Aphidius gifuensis]
MDYVTSNPIINSPTSEVQSPKTSLVLRTPRKQDGNKQKHRAYQNSIGGLSVFPNHLTPPCGLTKFIARNPFDADLTNRLHMSVLSPSIFSKVSSVSPDSQEFSWTIDELAMMSPAKIDEFSIQNTHCSDPEAETHVQKAIDKFFSESQIHPSPWSLKKEPMKPLVELSPTESVEEEDQHSNKDSPKKTRTCWSQTELSLPLELPKSVEDALKPYFTFNQDQNIDNNDANTSNNSSLRRKLFFNHDDSFEDSIEESLIISPIKSTLSPAQSQFNGTPHCQNINHMTRNYGSPNVNYGNMSPLDVSPISSNTSNNLSYQNIRLRNRSRLNFTSNMSVDQSMDDKHSNENHQPVVVVENIEKRDDFNDHDTVEMVSFLNDTTPLKKSTLRRTNFIGRLNIGVDSFNNIAELKNKGDSNNTLVGECPEQSSAFQSQDTGYQTNSINNLTENQCLTPIKKPFYWNDKLIDDVKNKEIKLSEWQGNIMFSSTPSKYNILHNN